MAVRMVISLLKIPYTHRVYVCLGQPYVYTWFKPTLNTERNNLHTEQDRTAILRATAETRYVPHTSMDTLVQHPPDEPCTHSTGSVHTLDPMHAHTRPAPCTHSTHAHTRPAPCTHSTLCTHSTGSVHTLDPMHTLDRLHAHTRPMHTLDRPQDPPNDAMCNSSSPKTALIRHVHT